MSMQSTLHWPLEVVQTTRKLSLTLWSSMRQFSTSIRVQLFPPLSQMSIQNGQDWTGQKGKAQEGAAGQSTTIDRAASSSNRMTLTFPCIVPPWKDDIAILTRSSLNIV